MTDETHATLREIFVAAAELQPEQRDAFLESACAGDATLRAEVEELLRHDDIADVAFLQSPVRRQAPDSRLPATIGRYRVTARLGSGGMAVVYEGAQESPYRAIAIKVIRSGMMTERLIARFRNEAEILGRLDHPGIARIYEAGTATIDGSEECPFFAMELVRGSPLLEFARDLDPAARLGLFAEICDAVHHAHQKGVIHRDLKPANILVTDDGQVKVLDFGVARATDRDIQAVTVQTDAGQLLGTVPYMSPEQVLGDLGNLDTRSDVYSLGVVLFEMLTGALPHDVRERSVVEAARIIRDEESTRLGAMAPSLRGDLEWIVAKALEKDVERRYDSASALAADVRRYLANEPVLARPPSASYRLRKFVRRNKVGVGWGAAAAVLLLVGVAATVVQTIRATAAERSAISNAESWRREADRAQIGVTFLGWALANATRGEEELSLRAALDAAALRISDRFGGDPDVEADVRRQLGLVYFDIGAYAPAREQLLLAYEHLIAQERTSSFAYAALADVLTCLQACERELGHGEEAALRWIHELLPALEEGVARRDPATADAMRAVRADIFAAETPSRALLDRHLERVMTAYGQTAMPSVTGRAVALHLMYMSMYLGNVHGNMHVGYARAQVAILDALEDSESVARQLGVALWLEARLRAPDGEEERRVEVARRLLARDYGLLGWWLHDFQGILGDALVQRGREEDRAEIADRLTRGNRGLREMRSTDAAAHTLLAMRQFLSLVRLAALGHHDSVVHLVDQPAILQELQAGLEQLKPLAPSADEGDRAMYLGFLGAMAQSMANREGRTDRWYAVARLAGERASTLAAGGAGGTGGSGGSAQEFGEIGEKP